MHLIITVDTEEDNWVGFQEGGGEYTTRNAERLVALQGLFDEFRVHPTYLLTQVMASDPTAAGFLREVHADGRCEIGAHCHPWNTPPIREARIPANSMLCNLPPTLQYEKMRNLTEHIAECCGVRPVSFRAGRFAYSREVGLNLVRLGYGVDSSITPHFDWSLEHGADFTDFALEPYWRTLRDVYPDAPAEPLVEIPTTIGFLQRNFRRAARMHRRFCRQPFPKLKVIGLLYRLGLLNRVWLCPEAYSAREMIQLTEVLRGRGFPVVNLMFHSPTLLAGLTPFVRSAADERAFIDRIRAYLEYAAKGGIESLTLTESAAELTKNATPVLTANSR